MKSSKVRRKPPSPYVSEAEKATQKMPNWYYNKKALRKTPSFLDGITVEKEQRYRREGARFIINVGTKMGLRYDTMATGVVYFHRFYMFHSFKTFPRFITACCCLFLAGKVEETPKKCKDIIKTARSFLTEKQYLSFGEDPKEEVMTMERILLQTIKFDLQVSHPYGFLLKYAKCLKGDKGKLQKMVQMAWTFINDSLCTTLCLQWEPEVVAIALIYLAGKLSKFEVSDWVGRTSRHSRWWEVYVEDISVELLEDICHQVLDLYSTPIPNTPQDSPPESPVLAVKSGRLSLPVSLNALSLSGLPLHLHENGCLEIGPVVHSNKFSPSLQTGSLYSKLAEHVTTFCLKLLSPVVAAHHSVSSQQATFGFFKGGGGS